MKFSTLFLFILTALLFASCQKSDFHKDKETYNKEKECFYLIYPITYIMPDGSTITGKDKKGLWMAIKEWYEANPDVEEKPILQYPVDIKFPDGSIETIPDENTMITIKEDCEESDAP